MEHAASFSSTRLNRRQCAHVSIKPYFSLWVGRQSQRLKPLVLGKPKASVCGRSLTGIADSDPAGGMDVSPLCVFSGRGLYDELITRPEEYYRKLRV